MDNFIQKVFNEISLEKDPDLWQDEDDRLTAQRIQFLSGFQETQFKGQLQETKRSTLAKNTILSKGFLTKATQFINKDIDKAVILLNNALVLAEDPKDLHSILHLRLKAAYELCDYMSVLEGQKAIQKGCDPSSKDCQEMHLYCFKSRIQEKGHLIAGGEKAKETLLKKASDLLKADNLKEVKTLDEMMQSMIKDSPEKKVNDDELKLTQTNSSNPRFSDSVEVKRSDLQGRFVVAKKDLEPGDLFCIDEPSAVYLDKEHCKTNCWNCLRSCRLNCLPCSGC